MSEPFRFICPVKIKSFLRRKKLPQGVSALEKYLFRPADFKEMSYVEFHEKVLESLPKGPVKSGDSIYFVGRTEVRIHRRKTRSMICRMNILQPSLGEVYYLRLLLQHTNPTSFADARTVDGQVYDTFHELLRARTAGRRK